MILLLFLSCLIVSCLTLSWLKIWGKMTDSTPATKNHSEANVLLNQEPLPVSDSSEQPPQENGDSSSVPKAPEQAELAAALKGPKEARLQRTSRPPPYRSPQKSPLPSRDASPASGTDAGGPEAPDTSGPSSPTRPQARGRALSREDQKQAHIKRQLMTKFILGSFDDNSSDEDPGMSSFRESSRRGSRASLGALSLEAARTAGDSESPVPTMR